MDRLALGHLRVNPREWVIWTLRDFYLAYDGWREINVKQPWEIARTQSFFSFAPHASGIKKITDIFPLEWDHVASIKKADMAIVRPMTDEEKNLQKQILNG